MRAVGAHIFLQTADGRYMRKGDGQRKKEEVCQLRQAGARDDGRVKTKPPVPTRQDCISVEHALLSHREHASGMDYIRRNALDAIR